MKKYLFLASALLLSLAACTKDKDDIEDLENTDKTENTDNDVSKEDAIIYTATVFQYIDRNLTSGNPDNKVRFTWREGDKIKVYNEKGNSTEFDLIDGAGTLTATFSGRAPEGGSPVYAVYSPLEGVIFPGSTVTVSLPTKYKYKYEGSEYPTETTPELSKPIFPMIAKISEDSYDILFNCPVGIRYLKCTNVPAGTSKIVFSTPTQISGNFEVDFSETFSKISTQSDIQDAKEIKPENLSVEFEFTASDQITTRVVYLPLPCDFYNGYIITMYDASGKGTAYTSYYDRFFVGTSFYDYREIQAVPVVEDIVDLGLSVNWAKCNIGASIPEEDGYYFSWGEKLAKNMSIEIKSKSKWYGLTSSELESLGVVDSDGILRKEYDAANVIFGGDWHMPTKSEFQELLDNCNREYRTENGKKGLKFTSRINGNSIFLPTAGYLEDSSLYYLGYYGYYCCATASGDVGISYTFTFNPNYYDWDLDFGYLGFSIRPVVSK